MYESGFGLTYQAAPISDMPILGDADGDGVVTILDATAIQRTLASLDTISFHSKAADIDGDDEVTVLDATYIQSASWQIFMHLMGSASRSTLNLRSLQRAIIN